MSLVLVHDLWKAMRSSIETGDLNEAAEILVNCLIDNDFDKSEIKAMFKRDPAVQEALSFFVETPVDSLYHKDEEEEELYEDDHYDDDDDDGYQ
jgi:hypothetical protein